MRARRSPVTSLHRKKKFSPPANHQPPTSNQPALSVIGGDLSAHFDIERFFRSLSHRTPTGNRYE